MSSSNIPLARAFIVEVLTNCVIDRIVRKHLQAALGLMTRQRAVRRAPNQRQRITPDQKRRVRAMINTDLTQHDIANEVGIVNAGRVSEIMNGKR